MRHMTGLLTYALTIAMVFLLASCQSSSQSSSTSTTSSSTSSSQAPPSSAASDSSPSSNGEQGGENIPEQQASNEPVDSKGAPNDSSDDGAGEEAGMSSGGAGGEIMSDEEVVSILDDQLDESIAVFDGMIINERVAAQATENDLPEDDEPWGEDEPLFEEADISENSDSQEQASSPTTGGDARGDDVTSTARGAGDGTIISRSGVRGNAANTQAPADVPDGSDDDIVARQIREAALKEKDPVLREKLWDEYRKYKRGQ